MITCALKPWLIIFMLSFSLAVFAGPPASLSLLNKGDAASPSLEMRLSLTPHWSARFSYLETTEQKRQLEGYLYQHAQSHQQMHLMTLDWHPYAGHFRGSIGLAIKQHRWQMNVEPMINRAAQNFTVQVISEDLPDNIYITNDSIMLDLTRIPDTIEWQGMRFEIDREKLPQQYEIDEIDIRFDELAGTYTVEVPAISVDQRDIAARLDVTFYRYTPYFGIGWATPPQAATRLYYSFDFGFMYQRPPEIRLDVQGDIFDIDPRINDYLHGLRFEREQALRERAQHFKFMPYLSFGLCWLF